MAEYPKFSDLLGKTLTAVEGAEKGSTRVVFVCETGERFSLFHSQNCCESVDVEDVVGSISDLIGSPITLADEASGDAVKAWPSELPPRQYVESATWTFYKLATVKGYVDIRWLGESNGYYGESVSFDKD
jgi:hypothetical protein